MAGVLGERLVGGEHDPPFHPGTLHLEERSDGLHWSAEPPRSRQDIVEAVERGDLRAASWRMRVTRDSWHGDVRHIESIGELRDVSITANPAYPSAAVELRSQPENEEGHVPENITETATESPSAATETRSDPQEEAPRAPAGSLRVEDRASVPVQKGLADEFRSRGWPGELAELTFPEFESSAVTGPRISTAALALSRSGTQSQAAKWLISARPSAVGGKCH